MTLCKRKRDFHTLFKKKAYNKESSEELPQVKAAIGQDGVDLITILTLAVIALEAMILFQAVKDRFDGISPFELFSLPGGQVLFLAIGPMNSCAV